MSKNNNNLERIRLVFDFVVIILMLSSINAAIKSSQIAYQANILTKQEINYLEQLEKLKLDPNIAFDMTLESRKSIPPHFEIRNMGPVDAVQILVELVFHFYQEDKNSFTTILGDFDGMRTEIKRLSYSEINRKVIISPDYLNQILENNKPISNNVLEARISYRREVDMKLFIKRAFYFVAPNGKWVSETDNYSDDQIYQDLKNKLLNRRIQTFDILFWGDKLYDVDIKSIFSFKKNAGW